MKYLLWYWILLHDLSQGQDTEDFMVVTALRRKVFHLYK